jgi:hypothetical protein
MKRIYFLALLWLPLLAVAQTATDSSQIFKKRALEAAEINILTSFYIQDGQNAAVTGGIGTEKLHDFATDINVSIPIKQDGIFSINGTISTYTSASSSNLNPFSGASKGGEDEDEDDDDDDDDDDDREDDDESEGGINTGTPWAASSGASSKDTWLNLNVGYSHYSDNRNTIYSAHVSFANEYDYRSFGLGIGLVKLFNQKNTELGLSGNVYLDAWKPEYPTEIKTYIETNSDLNADFFEGTDIFDQNGNIINKLGVEAWKPFNTELINNKARYTYTVSLSFSQILSKTTQVSIFSDLTYQTGWLSNPMQRVYFADKANYYIGNATSIPIYTTPENKDVFQLADDIERMPDTRLKIPIGVRLNQYISENFVLRSYYRFYFDDWGIKSHTLDAELAIKIGEKFTLYPNYRFYNQTAADYFDPFEQLLSTSTYYTSDFDLSRYHAHQYGLGIKYADILATAHFWKIGLKNLTLDYNYYQRSSGLSAHIVSLGATFTIGDYNSKKSEN